MKVTLKDIADLANVSVATVSKIINNKDEEISEETRQRVKEIIARENYQPNILARSMITKRTNTLGLIIPDVRNLFFTDLVRGAEDFAYKHNYSILFCNTDDSIEKEMRYITTLLNKQVDGIVLVGSINRNKQLERKFRISVPVVTIDRDVNFKDISEKIILENVTGAYKALEHLISLGHRKIMFLSGFLDTRVSQERLEGYSKALANHNIIIDESLIHIGSFSIEFGYKTIMKKGIPEGVSAIFCGNDLIAFGAMKALKERGLKVPEDISVVGFDDIVFSSMITPELTTVRQPSYNLGRVAVKKLIEILENTSIDEDIELKLELIVRESTSYKN